MRAKTMHNVVPYIDIYVYIYNLRGRCSLADSRQTPHVFTEHNQN